MFTLGKVCVIICLKRCGLWVNIGKVFNTHPRTSATYETAQQGGFLFCMLRRESQCRPLRDSAKGSHLSKNRRGARSPEVKRKICTKCIPISHIRNRPVGRFFVSYVAERKLALNLYDNRKISIPRFYSPFCRFTT